MQVGVPFFAFSQVLPGFGTRRADPRVRPGSTRVNPAHPLLQARGSTRPDPTRKRGLGGRWGLKSMVMSSELIRRSGYHPARNKLRI